MDDVTEHTASNPDEFLSRSPDFTLGAENSDDDQTETQSSVGFAESSGETLDDGDAPQVNNVATNDEDARLGEKNSLPQDEGGDRLESTEQGETSTEDGEMGSQGEEKHVNITLPRSVGVEHDSDTAQENFQVSGHENSTPEISEDSKTEDSKSADLPTGNDLSAVHSNISETTNDSTSELHPNASEHQSSELTESSQSEAQTGDKIQTQEEQALESIYHIKWIKWKGINTPIITQNENGPCPLLAIVNVLLLQRRITLPPQQEFVTSGQLMEYIGDCILEEAPKRLPEGAQLNYEQNMHDAIAIMNKLQTGLDVNVKFTGVKDFEFTPECIVFDLLSIGLYHGWLIDPQNTEIASAVSGLSYNQLVEKIIASKQDGAESQLVSEGLISESFLEHTASQLTYHGLCELNGTLQDDQLCVFFRNNHFSTFHKHKDELFLLVTDQGFLTEDRVIWESLRNVEGDGFFVDAEFKSFPLEHRSVAQPAALPPTQQLTQEDQDYLVALSLQEEQENAARRPQTHPEGVSPTQVDARDGPAHQTTQSNQEWSDLQLAIQLQQEEERRQQQQQPQRTQTRPQPSGTSPARLALLPQPQQRSSNATQQRQEWSDRCVIL